MFSFAPLSMNVDPFQTGIYFRINKKLDVKEDTTTKGNTIKSRTLESVNSHTPYTFKKSSLKLFPKIELDELDF